MTDEQLRERILHPYELGEPIIINGKTIPKGSLRLTPLAYADWHDTIHLLRRR